MLASAFRLFEAISYELQANKPRQCAFTERSFLEDLIEELKYDFSSTDWRTAVKEGSGFVEKHFTKRLAEFPIKYDHNKNLAEATDFDALDFILSAYLWRSNERQARAFETLVAKQLAKLLPGNIHRVGFPRKKRDIQSFRNYLYRELGFKMDAIQKKEKDGGLDVLWQLPVGPKRLHPLVCFQCKNGDFDEDSASASVERAKKTFTRHSRFNRESTVLHSVVINGYVDELPTKSGYGFVLLGLTDLLSDKCLPADVRIL